MSLAPLMTSDTYIVLYKTTKKFCLKKAEKTQIKNLFSLGFYKISVS